MDNKTCRILCLYDLFYTGRIISFRDINDHMKCYGFEMCKKTIYRDIQLLKNAGILHVCYSQKLKAYIPADGDFMYGFCIGDFSPPEFPESQNQRRYMERIIRLCNVMEQVIRGEIEDPITWYHSNYPRLSDRTRQRDFELLRKVDYYITYESEEEFGPGGYYYDYPGRDPEAPAWQRAYDFD